MRGRDRVTVNRERLIEGIWERDATTWTGGDEAQWLGWLDEPQRMLEQVGEVEEFANEVVDTLEKEGVQKFSDSFAELLDGVKAKREAVAA